MFGTVIVDCDVVIYLDISDEFVAEVPYLSVLLRCWNRSSPSTSSIKKLLQMLILLAFGAFFLRAKSLLKICVETCRVHKNWVF